MAVPKDLVPEITRLIEGRHAAGEARSRRPNKALQPTADKTRRG